MNKILKVLIGCEESQTICKAFRELGHEAYSCDILPCSGGHPEWHLQMDVFEAAKLKEWDLFIGHPPCFVAGTSVLTRNGYKKIEDVIVGDEVLTHRGRFRSVTRVMSSCSDEIVNVKISGSPLIRTTPEHPFYTRSKVIKSYRDKETKKSKKIAIFSNPEWIKSRDFKYNDYVGHVLPPIEKVDIDLSLLWLMGRYCADGFIRVRNGKYEQLTICLGANKVDYFKEKCPVKASFYKKDKSVVVACIYNQTFVKQFIQFGMGAKNKHLPGWVLSLPVEQASAFLDGYLSGDGHINERIISCSSVSKHLSLGISLLMRRVYKRGIRMQYSDTRTNSVIEGRLVNQSPIYSVICANDPNNSKKSLSKIEGDYTWNIFRYKESIKEKTLVYNLSVDEDESYIVENAIVHNCTFLSSSGAQWYYHPEDKHLPTDKRRPHPKYPNRAADREDAVKFFMDLYNLDIPHLAIENPVGIMSTRFRKPDCVVNPWQFGDSAQKTTCFWLKNLPLLSPTNIVDKGEFVITKSGKKLPKWYDEARKSKNRRGERSKTFPGMAKALASQWSDYILSKDE